MGRARAEDDNWFGVQDPRKRKQIQDRLAQRARRRRLAEAKKSSEPLCFDNQGCQSMSTASPQSVDSEGRASENSNYVVAEVPRSPSGYQALVSTSQQDKVVVGSLSTSVYAALHINGAMMGIACSVTSASRSCPVGPDIPESLRPTDLQLTMVHPRWIDRFPFPKMRDNMITLLSIIDEEEFLGDLFCLTSFTLNAGAASWDPKAWKIGKEFSAKWGYLFY